VFTEEQREQFRHHREKCVAEYELQHKDKPRMSKEEFHQLLLQCPIADAETIKLQDEVREEMRRWQIE
jgi:hypothetical protein